MRRIRRAISRWYWRHRSAMHSRWILFSLRGKRPAFMARTDPRRRPYPTRSQ